MEVQCLQTHLGRRSGLIVGWSEYSCLFLTFICPALSFFLAVMSIFCVSTLRAMQKQKSNFLDTHTYLANEADSELKTRDISN